MMEAISRREHEEAVQKQAHEDFSGHDTYRVIDTHQWRVFQRGTNIFAANIAVMGNCIAVWGDIDGCFFAYGPSSQNPQDVLRWLAGSNLGYAREKASIGMTGIGHEEDNVEVALYDIHALEANMRDDRDAEGVFDPDEMAAAYRPLFRALNAGYEMLKDGSTVEELRHHLYDNNFEAEDIYHIGRVTTGRVIYALEAVNTLVRLLGDA